MYPRCCDPVRYAAQDRHELGRLCAALYELEVGGLASHAINDHVDLAKRLVPPGAKPATAKLVNGGC